jgi:alpha-acetolactate decarboxylase
MKKIIITFVFSIVSTFANGQTAFDKFDKQEGVSTVIVNKKMFQMMGSVQIDTNDKETQQYLALIKKLDNLKVYTTSNPKISADMKTAVDKHLKTAGLEELMRVNDNGNNLKIWVKSGSAENQIKELVMFSEEPNKDNQTVLMSLTGNFNLNELAVLTDKMNIPGGDDLKKSTKGK